jgi:hypothetical protein
MIINITYDPSVVGAPAGFQTTVDAVAALYENHFTDNLTLNITVVYGALGPNGLGQSQPALASGHFQSGNRQQASRL